MKPNRDAAYCMDLVRKTDNMNFLATLFASSRHRPTLFAICAFNSEIKQIRARAPHSNIAKMRLAFWRDSLDSIYKGSPPDHPVCTSICRALEETRLSKSWFNRIIKAREDELELQHFGTVESLEQYSECLYSSLIYLNLEAMGITNLRADHAASHIGRLIS